MLRAFGRRKESWLSLSVPRDTHAPPLLEILIDSSFIPPLVYAVLGSSRDLAVGTSAVGSLLIGSMLSRVVNPNENPKLFLHLAFTATLVAGIFQASLGILRLGLIVDLLSHATIVGFVGGAAIVVCLQQLKGMLGLHHFTQDTDLVSVMRSVISQHHQWRWESATLGCFFFFSLLLTRYISKRRANLFWISAIAPLTSVIVGSLVAYLTHAERHGITVIGPLKEGLNPPSFKDFALSSPYFPIAVKTGIVAGVIVTAEGIAVGRIFATFKSYHIDGNKELIAYGMMNIIGSCTYCYLTAGQFSRSAVNYNSGCKTAVSNIIMSVAIMITLLFLTPLFYHTPLVILSAIIMSAMLNLIDYQAAMHLWKIDKFDFVVCMSAFIGVVFISIEIGLLIAVAISVLRVLLYAARPRTYILGSVPNSVCYRNLDQYPNAQTVAGILVLRIAAPIYFTNASYLRERILRRIDEEEDKLKLSEETNLQYVILNMDAIECIDASGISMLEEVEKITKRRGLKIILANPGGNVMKKLSRSKLVELLGQEWVFLTVMEAVEACKHMLHTCISKQVPSSAISTAGSETWANSVV